MNNSNSKSLGERFMEGWQTLFGKGDAQSKKLFPKDHFFSSEEIDFLKNSQEELSTLEKWAVQLSTWVSQNSTDKDLQPPVKWQMGRLSTWIDGKEEMDSKAKQVERLQILKMEGYEIPAHYESLIEDKEATDLVGLLFHHLGKESQTLAVDVFYRDDDRTPTIGYSQFASPSSQPELHEVALKDFQGMISSKDIIRFSSKEAASWKKQREEVRRAYISFHELLRDIKDTYPPMFSGIFSGAMQEKLPSSFFGKDIIPVSWSLANDKEIWVNAYAADSHEKKLLRISASTAHEHLPLIEAVKNLVEKDNLDAHLERLTTILGSKIGDSILLTPKNPSGIQITHDQVHGIIISSRGNLSVYKKPGHEEVEITLEDKKLIKEALLDECLLHIQYLNNEGESASSKVKELTKQLSLILGGEEILSQRLSNLNESNVPKEEAEPIDEVGIPPYSPKEEADMAPTKNAALDVPEPSAASSEVNQLFAEQENLLDNYLFSFDDMSSEEREQMEKQIEVQMGTNEELEVTPAPQPNYQRDGVEKSFIPTHGLLFQELEGRWHTPEIKQKEAYTLYGQLISERLSLQATYPNLPWIKSGLSMPVAMSGSNYDDKTSLLLALVTEKEGYEVSIYMTEKEVVQAGLQIDMNKESFPIVVGNTVQQVYNIEQTNFPETNPKKWEDLKQIYQQRVKMNLSPITVLTEEGKFPAKIVFDGKKGLVSYSSREDIIHLSPQSEFEEKDDYLRDLSIGLMRSTRKVESKQTKYMNLVKEDLLAHIGGAIIGQKYQFEVRSLGYNKYWKELLKRNPTFTQKALAAAEHSTSIIYQYADKAKVTDNYGASVDLRTTTPIEGDVDGNGIVESQENLAADTKQGAQEAAKENDSLPHQGVKTKHCR